MYYIYHIPGIKIGCSQNIKKRINSQKFSQYTILEEHYDVFEASNREIQLQKQYGYKVDRIPYWLSLERISKAQKISAATKEEWLPNVDWKARDAKIDFAKRAEKIKSHPNYQNRIIKNNSEKLKKVLLQYDLDGNFIQERHEGVKFLSKNGFDGIGSAARKEKGTICGFQWRYKTSEDYPKQIEKYENPNWQKVIQKDKKGNIIKIWDNQQQAATELNCSLQLISRVCRGIGKTAKGFIWERY
jgi:hypothetical protein